MFVFFQSGQLALAVNSSPTNARDLGDRVPSLGQEDHQEEGTATHSSIFAWRIPWTEEPGRVQTLGSQRVRRLK